MGDALLTWGAGAVLWLQSFSNGPLDAFFRAVTFLGEEQFYLVLLPSFFGAWIRGRGPDSPSSSSFRSMPIAA